tara:strand:- start:408 stop:509 length:102 start_codon:yes stop_codon:yes gene_type:complete
LEKESKEEFEEELVLKELLEVFFKHIILVCIGE